jgi:hypothetical protein
MAQPGWPLELRSRDGIAAAFGLDGSGDNLADHLSR